MLLILHAAIRGGVYSAGCSWGRLQRRTSYEYRRPPWRVRILMFTRLRFYSDAAAGQDLLHLPLLETLNLSFHHHSRFYIISPSLRPSSILRAAFQSLHSVVHQHRHRAGLGGARDSRSGLGAQVSLPRSLRVCVCASCASHTYRVFFYKTHFGADVLGKCPMGQLARVISLLARHRLASSH